jgi:hypothetical protein
MIEFKIIATTDKSQQSTYQHLGRVLILGQTEGDMIIDDPSLQPAQVKIYHQDGGFLLENLAPEVEVRLNGKAISEPTPVKERDNLNMGRTTISFSRVDTADFTYPPPYEHPQSKNRLVPGSKELAILEALEVLSKKAGNAPPTSTPPPGIKPPLPPGAPPPPKK